MLKLEALRYAHGGQSHDYLFEMEAKPGEITAVMGASGSGKSTLLDLIAGFVRPKAGDILLDARSLVRILPEKRPVSILFQSESLFEHLTAARNVALGLPAGMAKEKRANAVDEALEEVGLAGIGQQKSDTLSGGQKQRVALARTLVRARPILLLDEPFSALDETARIATRNLVADLTRQHNWHTVLVSHHSDDIAAIARRVYLLENGRLTLAETPSADETTALQRSGSTPRTLRQT